MNRPESKSGVRPPLDSYARAAPDGSFIETRLEGSWGKEELLVGTPRGLLQVSCGRARQLFAGNVYGICLQGGRIYFTDRVTSADSRSGRVLSARLTADRIWDLKIEIPSIDWDVHQIDFVGSALLMADTANNAIRVSTHVDGTWSMPVSHHPRGPLTAGSASRNYVHINSVFGHGGAVFAMYHNYSAGTGRYSEVAILSASTYCERDLIQIPACSAHNVLFADGSFYCCDSQRGRLLRDSKVVFSSPAFLRGLARTTHNTFVGESAFATRSERSSTLIDGSISRLDNEGMSLAGRLVIKGHPSIREVRVISERDFGLSESHRNLEGVLPE